MSTAMATNAHIKAVAGAYLFEQVRENGRIIGCRSLARLRAH